MKIVNESMKPCEFKDRLKEAMTHMGISQTALVQITNIPKSAMSQYLSGAFVPKQERLSILAQALNVQEAWLLGYNVPMRREQKYIVYDEITGTYDDEDPLLIEIYSYLETFSQEERKQLLQYLKDKDKSLSSSFLSPIINEKESQVLFAYRTHPEMQPAVDRLLGIEKDDKIVLYQAAHSDNNAKDGYIKKDKTQWNKIEKASETEDDLL